MIIEDNRDKITGFVSDLIDECRVTVDVRRARTRYWRDLFYTGKVDGVPVRHNKCFPHINKLASFLFSPADARFSIEVEGDETEATNQICEAGSRVFARKFSRANCGLTFGRAVKLALYEECCFTKMVWTSKGFQPFVIPQRFLGVLREDIEDLDQQEAFTHSFYQTPAQFKRLLGNHPDKEEILRKVKGSMTTPTSDIINDSYFHEMIVGGLQPISSAGVATGSGQAAVFALPPSPQLSPDVVQDLIRVDDLWVWDDDMNDYVTFRFVAPDILIEGRYRRRNLSDIPAMQPFTKVCPNTVEGYFWGRSELGTLSGLQGLLNARIQDADELIARQARPPHAITGAQGVTQEKLRALLSRGGMFVDDSPTTKVTPMPPQVPTQLIQYIEMIENWFEEESGFPPTLSGYGDSGVRSNAQAQTLVRASSPPLRDRALLIESQFSEYATKALKMQAAKDPSAYRYDAEDEKGKPREGRFLLSQLPKEATVFVDSHSASPAFSSDNINMAFALRKADAIDSEDLIEMVQPPRTDDLIQKAKKREAHRAEVQKIAAQTVDGAKKMLGKAA